jgi:hypothetical protein
MQAAADAIDRPNPDVQVAEMIGTKKTAGNRCSMVATADEQALLTLEHEWADAEARHVPRFRIAL